MLGSERISNDLYDSFTVFTHVPGSVESAAMPAVRQALAWADQRLLGGHRWLSDAPNAGQSAFGTPSAAALTGEVVRLRACITHSTERCRVAVVRLTGNLKRPLQVFEWRTVAR